MKLTTKKLYQLIQESLDTEAAADQLVSLFTRDVFEDSNDFINKVKIYKHYDDTFGELFYSLYLPNPNHGKPTIACTIGFDILAPDDNCRPDLENVVGTAILSSAARNEEFRGMGLGKILSLIALADLSKWKYSVTTDRDTSDSAGSSLVNSLNMLPINKSKPFDYIGWLKQKIGTSLGYFRRYPEQGEMYSEQLVNLQKLYNHLQPLTPYNFDDDCSPSVNLLVDKDNKFTDFAGSAYLPKFAPIVEKLLSISNEKINELLNLDKNVIAYTFDLNSQSFKEPLQYLLQHTVYQYDDDEEYEEQEEEKSLANKLFGSVYKKSNVPRIQMFGDDMIKESISKDHREKLIKLLLNSVEDAVFAFDLMDRLEINDTEQLKIINDAILRDPKMAQNPAGVGKISELHQTLKQKINQILTKDFDLGDI